MEKKFSIKATQAIKSITKPATKSESNNLMKFVAMDGECCRWDVGSNFTSLSKPVFSL
ncbi:hypothetical protein [Spirosoma foliorum]|uniref:Uncharacterized protein n=1 Tax=Spirosoma foliorum TaxID=2710596 RepID=A0A7G5GVD9_9BACT|nr:hypothetical protein [Spirosoma foliorum]QMW02831.1 hypothetical protein H3H32_33895 [Spirosoma foliorum]